jgi:hypothetical protein
MKSFPRVRFVTASEALGVMPDKAQGRKFSAVEIGEIAGEVTSEVSFQVRPDYALTASEQFELLNDFVARAAGRGAWPCAPTTDEPAEPVVLHGTPYGPALSGSELVGELKVPWSQFSRSVSDVAEFLQKNGQIPNVVWLGSTPVPPESYLVALAQTTQTLLSASAPPDSITLQPAHLSAARFVADDSPALWDWIIFPEGFDAPQLMTLAKLQAWTLKPALLAVGR